MWTPLKRTIKNSVSVNIFYIDNDSILIYRRTKNKNTEHQINLLLIEARNEPRGESDEEDKSHYVFIKNYDKLVGQQTNKGQHKKYHCFHCGHGFKLEQHLKEHEQKGCMTTKEQEREQEIEMPKECDIMAFKNHYKN